MKGKMVHKEQRQMFLRDISVQDLQGLGADSPETTAQGGRAASQVSTAGRRAPLGRDRGPGCPPAPVFFKQTGLETRYSWRQ